jgi:cell division septal protein FtsQ
MWFKRKQKNRRRGGGQMLDVKLRSDQVRAKRVRLVSLSVLVVGGTALGLYLFWRAGEWTLDKFVYENPAFAIQRVDVQTDGVIAPEQLRRWSGVKPGANLIALDLAAVKRNLELVPNIDSVSIERALPHTLKIRVAERVPVAQINVPRADGANGIMISVYQLDAAGVVMQPLDPRLCTVPLAQMNSRLPVITGLNVYQLQIGRRVESAPLQAALQLLRAFGLSPMMGLVDLQRVDVSSPQVIVITTAQGGKITFGLQNVEQQLRRWREIYDYAQSRNAAIMSLDLAVTDNTPVQLLAVAAAPKNINPANTRR